MIEFDWHTVAAGAAHDHDPQKQAKTKKISQ
jgi:hypothetical protein